jgi:hypothetical protein
MHVYRDTGHKAWLSRRSLDRKTHCCWPRKPLLPVLEAVLVVIPGGSHVSVGLGSRIFAGLPEARMKWRERLGIRPTTITVATEGFSSAFYTTCFGFRKGWRLLHFFTVNELLWKNITFSRAVTYSQNELSIQPLHVRRLLCFLQHGLHGCTPP